MTRLLLDLPEELAVDLELFCKAHYGAPKAAVIREALGTFILNSLEQQPGLRAKFHELRSKRAAEVAERSSEGAGSDRATRNDIARDDAAP